MCSDGGVTTCWLAHVFHRHIPESISEAICGSWHFHSLLVPDHFRCWYFMLAPSRTVLRLPTSAS